MTLSPQDIQDGGRRIHLSLPQVASRLDNRVQLTTDGAAPYLIAVDRAFDGEIDYAMLQKIYGA